MENISGTVVSVQYAPHVSRALVAVDTERACARCAAGKGCGAGLLAGRDECRQVEAPVAPGIELRPGDTVRLGLAPGQLMAAALHAWGLPLAGAVCGASLASSFAAGDAIAAVAAVTGALTGAAWARRRLRQACLATLSPTIVERLPRGSR